jgi:hypothetical protein
MEGPIYEVKSTGSFYVVYDADDGNIVHTHEYIALAGAEYPPESEIEAEALEMAARATGKEVERMGTLRVRKDDLRVGAEYAVDLREERLAEQQPPT